ncbi:MAG: hypothetical protein PHI64_05795 [Zoogloea sp.]|uniref:hypothetical protein n=1 Tax=Zoogloea sp. TaxID=49181 RepID=UPI0026129C47|nr:hypothetical protein [Zoogloea sp.]MDD2988460.1 hypothetical protein [Zoogloea sp.]
MSILPGRALRQARFALPFLALALGGCAVTSTVVSSIGARSLNGTAALPFGAEGVELALVDSPRSLAGGSVLHFAAMPYSSLSTEPGGEPAGRILMKPAEVRWESASQGEVTLLHEGVPRRFDVRRSAVRGQDVIAVESLYRRWYGYPAQSLLVATLPLDVAIDVVVLGGVLVSMPVVYGVRALRGGEAVESEKSLRGSPPSDGAGR